MALSHALFILDDLVVQQLVGGRVLLLEVGVLLDVDLEALLVEVKSGLVLDRLRLNILQAMKLILDFFFALLKNFLVDALAKRIRLFLAVVLVFELLCKSVEIESALIRIGGCLDLIEQIPLRVGRSGVVRTKKVNFDWRLLHIVDPLNWLRLGGCGTDAPLIHQFLVRIFLRLRRWSFVCGFDLLRLGLLRDGALHDFFFNVLLLELNVLFELI